MTPLRFTIEGSIGILAGLGRHELSMDFAEIIPDDAVTIALRGDNGMGKSTVLNLALTPWLNPPQLPGNIYDHFGETGLREIDWAHNGTVYRSRLEYRQTAKTKTTKAYLWAFDPGTGATAPVRLPDNTVSDGKARTYETCLTSIVGPMSLYFLSAFRAQNAPRLADYDDPKGFMRDLLHLGEIQNLSQNAREVSRELRRAYESIKDDVSRLDEKRDERAALQAEALELAKEEPGLKTAKREAEEAHALVKAEFQRVVSEDLDRQRVIAQRVEITNNIRLAEKRFAETMTRIKDDIAAVNQAIRATNVARIKHEEFLQSQIGESQKRAQAAEAFLERREEIEGAAEDLPKLKVREEEMEKSIMAAQAKVSAYVAKQGELRKLESDESHIVVAGASIKAKCEALIRMASLVDEVPCHGEGEYADCPLLSDAVYARQQGVAIAKEERTKQLDKYRANHFELEKLRAEIDQAADPAIGLKILNANRNRLQAQIQHVQGTAALMPQLAQSDEVLVAEKEKQKELDSRLVRLEEEIDARLKEHKAAEYRLSIQRPRAVADKDSDIEALQEKLSALPEPDEDPVIPARRALEQSESTLTAAASALESNVASGVRLGVDMAALDKALSAGADIVKKARLLEEEIAQWTLLGVALRGVMDLSIEDAGPGIADIANRLLREAYGPRFTIRIITQREQANGRLVECFDISVIDAETGVESSIVHKSGGETVWLDKALTDAVGIFHQDASGMSFETLFSDEAEDGLTEPRKAMFYKMDRAALQLGEYRRKVFVSHHPAAWDMADAVINLADYRMEQA